MSNGARTNINSVPLGSWRKSSFSAVDNCVEVMLLPDERVAVRNSRFPDDGNLLLDRESFTRWIDSIKAGVHDALVAEVGSQR